MKKRHFLFSALSLLSASVVQAADPVTVETTTIRGNSEMPKSTFIAPWRSEEVTSVTDMQMETLLEAELHPIERGEFQRKLKIQQQLSSQ